MCMVFQAFALARVGPPVIFFQQAQRSCAISSSIPIAFMFILIQLVLFVFYLDDGRIPGCHIHHTGIDHGSGSNLQWSQRTGTQRLLHQSRIAGCYRNARARAAREFADSVWSRSLARSHHHITDQSLNVRDVRVVDSGFISDHQLILASMDIIVSGHTNHSVSFSYRPIKSINPVGSNPDFVVQFCSRLMLPMPSHSPSRSRTLWPRRGRSPTNAISKTTKGSQQSPDGSRTKLEAKRHRRKLERQWKAIDFIPTSLLELCPAVFSEIIAVCLPIYPSLKAFSQPCSSLPLSHLCSRNSH